jgi:hypothetical protein
MQYVLTEEEYKRLVPRELLDKSRATSNDYYRRLSAFGKAVNEHPDGERIWNRQRDILERAEAANPELFKASTMLLPEKDEFSNVLVDYGQAEYAEEGNKCR